MIVSWMGVEVDLVVRREREMVSRGGSNGKEQQHS